MVELELIDRERPLVERLQGGEVPHVKSPDSFEFKAILSVNKTQVLEMNGASFRLNHRRARKKGRRVLIVTPSSAENAAWA